MSHLDGILTTADFMKAAIEVKWRRFNYETLMKFHQGELLVGSEKVLAGKALPMLSSCLQYCCICWRIAFWCSSWLMRRVILQR